MHQQIYPNPFLLVVSKNPVSGETYSIQHYVVKFGSDLRQVDGVLRVSFFNNTDRHNIAEICSSVLRHCQEFSLPQANIIVTIQVRKV